MGKAQFSRHVLSKWRKTNALLKKQSLRPYIPVTRKMTKSSLRELLLQYNMVYIKPDRGMHGIGVMRVETDPDGIEGAYRYQCGTGMLRFATYDRMYDSILKRTKRRLYLVQRGIHLTKYRGRRFDIRVMVQQSPRSKWETTGIIGRVAQRGKVVSNVHNGGTLKPVETLLAAYVSGERKKKYIRQLRKLGLRTAHQLHSRFRGLKEVGLDVALDKKLHPWLLEVNTAPDPYIFGKLKDKSIFRKVYRYAKAYGRVK